MWLISNLSARWATAPELSSCCRCTTRESFPPWMKARALIPTRLPQSAVRWSSQQTSVSQNGIVQPRWGRCNEHLMDGGSAVFFCDAGCESVGGGRHSTEGAPSSASEAQWEESRATGLPGSFIRPHHTAAKVRILQYGDDASECCKIEIIFHLYRFWKKAGYSPVYLRQTPVSLMWY